MRKVKWSVVVAGATAFALGCNGSIDVEAVDDAGRLEPTQEEAPPAEQRGSDVWIDDPPATVSEPVALRVVVQTEATVEVEWSAPREGKDASYILDVNGEPVAATQGSPYVYSGLACGTSYSLGVVASTPEAGSPRASIEAQTAACGPSDPAPQGDATALIVSSATAGAGYSAAVMADSPLAYWRLNESSGTRAADAMGVHHGTYVNGVSLGVAGGTASETAASFDGVDDVLNVPDHSALRLNGSFSIEFMARLHKAVNSYPGILGKGRSGSSATGFIVYYQPIQRQPALKRAGVDGLITSSAGALTSDRLRHYVFTYDSATATARWYVSGVLDKTYTNIRFPANTDASQFQIGRADLGQHGNQVLDEIALYRSALSAARVSAHFGASSLAPATATPPPAPSPAPRAASLVGVASYKPADYPRIAALGVKRVRTDRPTAKAIELARTYGIELLPIAGYGFTDLSGTTNPKDPPLPQHRAEWARRMVDTWRAMQSPPKVIEVWNEPWHASFWGGKPDPAAYLELVKAFAKEAWAIWPSTTLLVSADQGMAHYPNFRRDLLAADKTGFLSDPRILPTYPQLRGGPHASDGHVAVVHVRPRSLSVRIPGLQGAWTSRPSGVDHGVWVGVENVHARLRAPRDGERVVAGHLHD